MTFAIGLLGQAQAFADVQTTVLSGFGNDQVIANDINNKTQIVGSAITVDPSGDEREVAFLWEKGGITDLGTLGGPCSVAIRIDEGGVHIVGQADISSAAGCFEQPQAFLSRQPDRRNPLRHTPISTFCH